MSLGFSPLSSNPISGGSLDIAVMVSGGSTIFTNGSLIPVIIKDASGNGAIFAGGLLAQTINNTITGQATALANGSLFPSLSIVSAGYATTITSGTPTIELNISLTGHSITSTNGSVSADAAVTQNGQNITFTGGTIVPNASILSGGASVSFSNGSLSPAASVTLGGQKLTFANGTIIASHGPVTVSVSGNSCTFSKGSLSYGIGVSLHGASSAFTSGGTTTYFVGSGIPTPAGSTGFAQAVPFASPTVPHTSEKDMNAVAWQKWFQAMQRKVTRAGELLWSQLNFYGSNLTDIAVRNHNDLQGISGGAAGDYQHITAAERAALDALVATPAVDAYIASSVSISNRYFIKGL